MTGSDLLNAPQVPSLQKKRYEDVNPQDQQFGARRPSRRTGFLSSIDRHRHPPMPETELETKRLWVCSTV
jgi:hypothetical protein